VHDYSGNADNTKYVTGLPSLNVEETQEYLAWVVSEWNKDKPKYYAFAIILGGKIIGEIAFGNEPGTFEASIGWIIHRDYWNCGYATEAAVAMKNHLFNSMSIVKLVSSCDVDNLASRRIMQKLGMQLQNENEPWEYRDGRISKSVTYCFKK